MQHLQSGATPATMARADLAPELRPRDGGGGSAVSWPAVAGGAFVIAALSLALLSLGTGLGFASISVWANSGVSGRTVGVGATIWLVLMQIVSSSAGGYLAGRLRTKWTDVHLDEIYFRDTAHGFLAWAVAFVVTAAALMSAATAMTGSALSRGGVPATTDTSAYFVDSLLRVSDGSAAPNATANATEAGRIFGYSLQAGRLTPEDSNYLAQLISARTGITRQEANARVTSAFGTAQRSAEEARKAMAHTFLWAFAGLLVGAFCASLAATWGGRQRDSVVV